MSDNSILLILEEAIVRDTTALILECEGFKVITASQASDVKSLLLADATRTGNIRLVVIDAEMPLVQGADLLGFIRSDSRFSNIPLVLASTRGYSLMRLVGNKVVPFSSRELIECVHRKMAKIPQFQEAVLD